MDRESFQGNAGQLPGLGEAGGGLIEVDAEFVTAATGRDVGVGPGIDVGIDPKRDRRAPALLDGEDSRCQS